MLVGHGSRSDPTTSSSPPRPSAGRRGCSTSTHRRFIKTHTPLDGLPEHPSVTFIAVVRHPLDVALSDLDHDRNGVEGRAWELRVAAVGEPGPDDDPPPGFEPPPQGDDPHERLVWFIDNHNLPRGSGPYGLEDFCHQVGTYWRRRDDPTVHLFHYQDLWDDLGGEMRQVAAALGVAADEARFLPLVEAARLESMRARAEQTAPEADQGIWTSPAAFFRSGGRRDWAALLSPAELDRFHDRLSELSGDAADWILHGRRGKASTSARSP